MQAGAGKRVSRARGNRGRGGSRHRLVSKIIALLVAVYLSSLFTVPAGATVPAINAAGAMLSWGTNRDGELGYVSTMHGCNVPCQPAPQLVPPIKFFVAMTGGEHHTLAVKADGTVWAWGYNGYGELGNGQIQPDSNYTPGQVAGLAGVRAVAAGVKHSVALKRDGTVWTWGWNAFGQLGAPSGDDCWGDPCSLRPVQVVGPNGAGYLSDVVAIAAGSTHSLAVKQDGTVWAWGDNLYGELGINSGIRQSATPVQVVGPGGTGFLSDIVGIASESEANHSLAVQRNGTVWAWGSNNFRQLGQPCSNPFCQIPLPVAASSGVRTVAAGGKYSLALKWDGTVWGWGADDFGQLGFPYNGSDPCFCTNVPTQATGIAGVTAIAAGYQHSLARKRDGTLWGVGDNSHGALGLGTADLNKHPIFAQVPYLSNVTAIGAGSGTSLAIAQFGPGPAAGVSPYTLVFPTQPYNTVSPPQFVTVTNYGSGTVVVNGASFQDTGRRAGCTETDCGSFPWEFRVDGSPFPLSIPAGGSMQIGIVFAPVVQGFYRMGPSSAFMALATNVPASPLTVDITGHAGPW